MQALRYVFNDYGDNLHYAEAEGDGIPVELAEEYALPGEGPDGVNWDIPGLQFKRKGEPSEAAKFGTLSKVVKIFNMDSIEIYFICLCYTWHKKFTKKLFFTTLHFCSINHKEGARA